MTPLQLISWTRHSHGNENNKIHIRSILFSTNASLREKQYRLLKLDFIYLRATTLLVP